MTAERSRRPASDTARPARATSASAAFRRPSPGRRAGGGRGGPPSFGWSPAGRRLLRGALDEAVRLLRADGGLVYLRDRDDESLRFALDVGISERPELGWVRRLRLQPGVGMFGRAVATGRVVATGDYEADESFTHAHSTDRVVRQVGMRSLVVAPLGVAGKVIGALGVYSAAADAFGEADIALVRALAEHSAAAIENARLIRELARRRRDLAGRAAAERALREISGRIIVLREPDEVLQLTVDAAARLLSADGARIDLLDPESGALNWAYDALTGRRPGLGPIDGPGEAEADEGISGMAVRERRPFWTGDYLADRRFRHAAAPDAFATEHNIRSALAAPLMAETGPIGTLTVYAGGRDAFDADDAALIQALADQATIAITNAGLIDQLNRSRDDLARRVDAERALRELAGTIIALREPAEVLQRTVDVAATLLSAEVGEVGLLDAEGRFRWVATATTDARARPVEPPVDERTDAAVGIGGLAIREGSVVRTGDYLADPRIGHAPQVDDFARDLGVLSAMSAPLRDEGGPIGVLNVASGRPNAFSEDDEALLQALADEASIAVTNARLIGQLHRSREDLARQAAIERALREVASSITTMPDSRQILHGIAAAAARLLGSERAFINLLNDQTGAGGWTWYSPTDVGSDPWPADQAILIGEGVSGKAIAERRPFWTGDYLRDERFVHRPGPDHYTAELSLPSAIAAPIFDVDQPLGAILVESHEDDAFGEEDADLLEILARLASIALRNARLIEALEQSREEVARRADAERALREIAAKITAIRDPRAVLQQTVQAAMRLLGARGGRIDLLDVQTGRYVTEYASFGGVDQLEVDDSDTISSGVSGRALSERRPFITGDYLRDDRFEHSAGADKFVRDSGITSLMAAPLLLDGQAIGALSVADSERDAFDEAGAALLQALADQAAIAVGNTRLIEELRRSREEASRSAETEHALRDIAARLAVLGDPGEVLARIVDEARRLLGSDGAHLTQMSADRTYVYPVVIGGAMDEATSAWMRTQEFPIGGGINGLAAGSGEVVWTGDYLVDPRIPHSADDQEVAERMELRAMAAAPLRSPGGEVIGTLAISYRRPRDISAAELSLLQGLADHAAIALANSRLLERLASSESRYRFLVQSSPDLIWSADVEGRFIFLSDRSLELFGHPPEELVGRHWSAVVHPASMDEARERWAGVLANPNEPQAVRLTLLGPGGAPRDVELSTIAMVSPSGRVEGALGSVRDIAEQQRLERELRESESRYRYLVQSSPDSIWLTDDEGRFTFWSENVEGLLGRSSHDLVGVHFSEIVGPESVAVAASTWEHLRADPDLVIRTRIVLIDSAGAEVATEVSAVPIFEAGQFQGAHGSLRDVRARERLERELRESEARYRFLVESSPDIVWEVDAEGRFVFASDAAAATGYEPQELVGRHFSEIVHPATMSEATARWEELLRDPTGLYQARFSLLHRDGQEIPIENFSTGIVRDGRFVGAHGSARNLSDRVRMERDLRRQAVDLAASAERAHLARELHDSVTQALFSMTLVSRSIEMQMRSDPEAALARLGDLRELQREALAEMRSLIFELRPGSIERDGLEQALRTHVAALESRVGLPIVVDADLPERLPIAVEETLYRVAQEALHNVVKHASATQVRLSVGRTARDAWLTVEDDGQGFDPAALPPDRLGLTGMQARAERAGGQFAVRSTPGGGTVVELRLPLDEEPVGTAGERMT